VFTVSALGPRPRLKRLAVALKLSVRKAGARRD